MLEFSRYLEMKLPKSQSTFLWGARKTGKSFYLNKHFANSFSYNLLGLAAVSKKSTQKLLLTV